MKGFLQLPLGEMIIIPQVAQSVPHCGVLDASFATRVIAIIYMVEMILKPVFDNS